MVILMAFHLLSVLLTRTENDRCPINWKQIFFLPYLLLAWFPSPNFRGQASSFQLTAINLLPRMGNIRVSYRCTTFFPPLTSLLPGDWAISTIFPCASGDHHPCFSDLTPTYLGWCHPNASQNDDRSGLTEWRNILAYWMMMTMNNLLKCDSTLRLTLLKSLLTHSPLLLMQQRPWRATCNLLMRATYPNW